jgi:hypothetical protein
VVHAVSLATRIRSKRILSLRSTWDEKQDSVSKEIEGEIEGQRERESDRGEEGRERESMNENESHWHG